MAPFGPTVAVSGGRVAASGSALPAEQAEQVIDASGQWLMPGLLDIHTHLDLEVDLEPGLPESFNVLVKELQALGLDIEMREET